MSIPERLRTLETRFHNIAHMTGIAADRLEQMFSRSEPIDPAQPELWYFGEEEVERTLFAVYEAQRMVDDLRELYLAAMRG